MSFEFSPHFPGSQKFYNDVKRPYYVDIDFPLIIRNTGSNRPALETVKGNITAPRWLINDFVSIEGQEIIHNYKEGSDIQWHIHMITANPDVEDRLVKWEIEWVWANPNSPLSDIIITESPDIVIPADTPNRSMVVREIALIPMPDMTIGAHIWARLRRIAASGPGPTDNIFASMLQLHVEIDSPGSITRTSK